ncbi:glycosyltransferase [Georgenia daeguensis]|uniref:Rhamnosyltransferase n=1 Tax=Georgenia daeguensis TaxID=908355 RepID=A0ABP8ESB8_9MICO
MPEFEHFLLTRFNVRHEVRASDDWLRHRLQYFESVCLPSVKAQTTKVDRWLVFLDAERDAWFEDRITRLAGDTFEPVWVDGPFLPEIAARETLARSSAPWVITTRMDNDDALARDFIEAIQSQFRHEREFLNFQAGLQLSEDGRLFYRSDPSNAFVSLVEPREELVTVFVDWHDRIAEHGPVRQIVAAPMWLQMVHGRNIGNQIRGIRANPALLAEWFDVHREAVPVDRLHLVADQVRSAAGLGLRVIRKPHRVVWALRVAINRIAAKR